VSFGKPNLASSPKTAWESRFFRISSAPGTPGRRATSATRFHRTVSRGLQVESSLLSSESMTSCARRFLLVDSTSASTSFLSSAPSFFAMASGTFTCRHSWWGIGVRKEVSWRRVWDEEHGAPIVGATS